MLPLLAFSVLAVLETSAAPRIFVYRAGARRVELRQAPGERAPVSAGCEAARDGCDARRALEKASLAATRAARDAGGGADPGALICRDLKGSVELGADETGAEIALCRFRDGSRTTAPALHAAGRRNDRRALSPPGQVGEPVHSR